MASPLELFLSFGKVGLFGFGGGQSMIPLVQAEVVDVRGWMTNEEFVNLLAAGNALPGPITVKMAVYVGYDTGGITGAAAGLVGVSLPATLLMLGLASFLLRHGEHPRVQGALAGVRPVVVAMLSWVVLQIAPTAVRGQMWVGGALILAALGLLWLKVHPAWLIAGAAVLGGVFLAK